MFIHHLNVCFPSHDLERTLLKIWLLKLTDWSYQYLALSEHNPAMGKLTSDEIVQIVKTKQKQSRKIKQITFI